MSVCSEAGMSASTLKAAFRNSACMSFLSFVKYSIVFTSAEPPSYSGNRNPSTGVPASHSVLRSWKRLSSG